ncbi:MAG: AmmeMemoRadiSam system protein B [Acidobacteriota bacterium]
MKKLFLILPIFIFIIIPFYSKIISQERQPAVAGAFYPKDAKELSSMIDKFIESVKPPEIKGRIYGIIVPHAGYIYSGRVAAYGYKLVSGRKYDAIVVIGPSHYFPFEGVSVYPKGYYVTPLGKVKIDEKLASEMRAQGRSLIRDILQAHLKEHSVEVQIPFIQKVFGDIPIVPLVMGNQDERTIKGLAMALSKALKDKNVLVVASTDLSHFHSKSRAKEIDDFTISFIENFDEDRLMREFLIDRAEMCGGGPVISMMMATRILGAKEVKILKYADSSDVGGPTERVVGYLSAAVIVPEAVKKESKNNGKKNKKALSFIESPNELRSNNFFPSSNINYRFNEINLTSSFSPLNLFQTDMDNFNSSFINPPYGLIYRLKEVDKEEKEIRHDLDKEMKEKTENFNLTEGQKNKLLEIARKSIEGWVLRKEVYNVGNVEEGLKELRGVFVTIKKKGELRGCIGFTEPLFPLWEATQRAAVYAAVKDPRFEPLSPEELKKIHIEISVLTPLKKISDIKEIKVGTHGLLISKEERKGLLLPQVAVDHGWTREQFLDQTCLKVGFPYGCWRKNAEIFIFEAEIFEEK